MLPVEVESWARAHGFSDADIQLAERVSATMRMGNRELVWLALLAMLVFAKKASTSPTPPAPGPTSLGPRLSLLDLRNLAIRGGFSEDEADVAAAIAMAESDGYQYAQGDPRGAFGPTPNGTSTSFGLWQVHTTVWRQYDPAQLLGDAEYNARAAHAIRQAQGWTAWSTYTNGWYRKYMPTA